MTWQFEEERFYTRHQTGFAFPDGSRLESEWTVHDKLSLHEPVAGFVVRRARGMDQRTWDRRQGETRRRAQLVCLALNRAERGHALALAVLKPSGVNEWILPFRVAA
jgi:hypothetical protein